MGSITLNKPSGGQLTISPEDGATNETVTIPAGGVGKVLQVVTHHINTGTTISTGNTWLDSSGGSFSFTPKSANSRLVITASAHIYSDTLAGIWESCATRVMVGNTPIDVAGFNGENGLYGVGTYSASVDVRVMGYAVVNGEVNSVSTDTITIKQQVKSIGFSTSVSANVYGAGFIQIMEVAQ